MAAAGVASRRAAEELIAAGRVRVDGAVVRTQGTRVDPARARIEVDGERINVSTRYEYVLLNKPAGVVSTVNDPQGRRTVLDLAGARQRVYPVGRLDAETTGLLLLTNHGELAHRLAHPRYQVPRVYLAEVRGAITKDAERNLVKGVRLEDGWARAKAVRVRTRAPGRSQVEVTMTEGRKHEVRRMFEAVEFPVIRLARTGFGPLRLRGLPAGATRRLSAEEVGRLLETVGI